MKSFVTCAIVAGLLASSASSARAADDAAVISVVIAGAADATFIGFDLAAVGRGQHLSREQAMVQTLVMAPQAGLFEVLYAYQATRPTDDQGTRMALLLPIPVVFDTLTMQAIWTWSRPSASPGIVLGVSAMVGVDTALTTSTIAHLASRRRIGRHLGIAQMIAVAPSIVAGAYELSQEPGQKLAWGTLTTWSSLLFVNGLIATIVGGSDPDEPSTSTSTSRIVLTPAPMSDGVARYGGLILSGTWF